MYNTNATSFRKDLFNLLEQTIKYNEVLNITTKEGSAVVMSAEDYNGLLATAEITANPTLYMKIKEGMKTPYSECIPESEVQW